MHRYDRMTAAGRPYDDCEPPGSKHDWKPCSFVFEKQLLDDGGRVIIRQPDLAAAKVHLVCMGCHSWTWIEAEWTGSWFQSDEQIATEETPLAKRERWMRGVT